MSAYALPLLAASAVSVAVVGGCSAKAAADAEVSEEALNYSGEGLVISQFYVGSKAGVAVEGAALPYDFVEIFNQSQYPRALDELTLQYGDKAADFSKQLLPGKNSQKFAQNTVLLGGQYLLVKLAKPAAPEPQPAPDPQPILGPTADGVDAGADAGDAGEVNAAPIVTTGSASPLDETGAYIGSDVDLDEKGGKIALVRRPGSIPCGATKRCLDNPSVAADIVDMVGYGDASDSEGAPFGALGTTFAARRTDAALCYDTQDNKTDFEVAAPAPHGKSDIKECWKGVGQDGITTIIEKDGTPGKDAVGKDGKDGKDGVDGKEGPAGANGVDGLHGSDGNTGKPGAVGPAGKTGAAGGGCSASPASSSMSDNLMGLGLAGLFAFARGRRRNKKSAK